MDHIYEKVQRIKLISVETWISRNDWFEYASDYIDKNGDEIDLYGDRSPCKDPLFLKNITVISGLCRKKRVGYEGDLIIYYTIPSDKWREHNDIHSDCIVLLKGMIVVKDYPDHYSFFLENKSLGDLSNIFRLQNSNRETPFSKSMYTGCSSVIFPCKYAESICYKIVGNEVPKSVLPCPERADMELYHKQIMHYYKAFVEHNLHVLKCSNLSFINKNSQYVTFDRERFKLKIRNTQGVEIGVDLLSSPRMGKILYVNRSFNITCMCNKEKVNLNTRDVVDKLLTEFDFKALVSPIN